MNAADVFERIKALSPPDRLRLAAQLLEAKRVDTAYELIRQVKVELGAAMAMARREVKP